MPYLLSHTHHKVYKREINHPNTVPIKIRFYNILAYHFILQILIFEMKED